MNDGLELQKRKISFFLKIFHTKDNSTPDYKTKNLSSPKRYFLNVTKTICCGCKILVTFYAITISLTHGSNFILFHIFILTNSKYLRNI